MQTQRATYNVVPIQIVHDVDEDDHGQQPQVDLADESPLRALSLLRGEAGDVGRGLLLQVGTVRVGDAIVHAGDMASEALVIRIRGDANLRVVGGGDLVCGHGCVDTNSRTREIKRILENVSRKRGTGGTEEERENRASRGRREPF